MTPFVFFLVAALLGAASFAFVPWGRMLGSTYGTPQWLRHSTWGALIGWLGAVAVLGVATRSTIASDAPRPVRDAADLGATISAIMHLLALAVAFYGAYALVMVVLTWRYRWSQKLPVPDGEPPYR